MLLNIQFKLQLKNCRKLCNLLNLNILFFKKNCDIFYESSMQYRVLRYTVRFFFFQKLAVSVAFNGAGCAGSVVLLHHLVPECIPPQKPSKTCF